MALTRNAAAVHERTGTYDDWHPGPHAAMILGPRSTCASFPRTGCMASRCTPRPTRGCSRSLQVFDATGAAVHKDPLRARAPTFAAWDRGGDRRLASGDTSDMLTP